MPRRRIPADPDAPIEMKTEQIPIGDEAVAVSWGRIHGFVQVGVRGVGADEHPGDPQYSHYTSLGYQDLRQLINLLRRAQRSAFKAA